MNYDTIIIGGGLSGLTAGVALARAGQKVAIAASGQNTLNYFSGSFDLLGYDSDGRVVEKPFGYIDSLSADHPYKKMAVNNLSGLADEVKCLLEDTGLKLKGKTDKCHYRFTPMGVLCPAWLSLDDCLTADSADSLPYNKVLLVNISGFMDFPVEFLAAGLERLGAEVKNVTISLSALHGRRESPYELRATSLARITGTDETLTDIASKINNLAADSDLVVVPAIFGVDGNRGLDRLSEIVGCPVKVVATMPPSVLGARVQTLLRNRFVALGGQIMYDARVAAGVLTDRRVAAIETTYAETFEADNYILATGSFQSHGLVADYRKVREPVFNLDIAPFCNGKTRSFSRSKWTQPNIFEPQEYMRFGVAVDDNFHPLRGGVAIDNLYAIGSVLSGHDAISQADGTGVSLLTSLAVAKKVG